MRLPVDSPVLAAVASPRRREILRLVWRKELAAGEIHRAMPDVTFGRGLAQLRAPSRQASCAFAPRAQRLYHAQRDALGPMAKMLEQMWDDALWRLKLLVELEQTRRGPRARRRSKRNRHT